LHDALPIYESLAGTTSEFARRRDALRARPMAAQAGEAESRGTRGRAHRARARSLGLAKSCARQRICHRRKVQAREPSVMLRAPPRGPWHEPASARLAVLNLAPYTETDSAV